MYYFLQWTWGLPLNLIGIAAYIILVKICGFKTYKYRKSICILIPWNKMTGLNLGMFIFHSNCRYDLVSHEYGHSIQNLIFGWFTPIIITIPSIIRFWYRKIKQSLGGIIITDYYDVWFEKQATALGKDADKNYFRGF